MLGHCQEAVVPRSAVMGGEGTKEAFISICTPWTWQMVSAEAKYGPPVGAILGEHS